MDFLKKRPIKLQLLLMFFLFLTAIVLVMFVTYTQSKKMIYAKNEQYSIELMDKITQYIESQIDTIDGLLLNTGINADVHQYLKTTDLLDKIDAFQKVDMQVTRVIQLENGIVDMTIVGENGNNLNLMSDLNKKRLIMDTIAKMRDTNGTHLKPYYYGFRRIVESNVAHHYFAVGTTINNIFPIYPLGHMVVILDLETLFPKFDTMMQNSFGNFYVLDRNGIVCSSSVPEMIGNKLDLEAFANSRDDKFIVQSAELREMEGKIVNIYSKDDLFRGLDQTREVYLWILAFFVPLMCLAVWIISSNIIGPIRAFMRFIQVHQIKNIYHEQKRLKLFGYHEIMVMADKFNGMLDEIDHLTNEVVSSKTRIMALGLMKKQAELAYLKQQVNPHFLYNMLESLKGMASETGAHEIREMLGALGRMLRYSIKGREDVKLREELEIAKAYLKLQQFRFDDRFDVHIDFPDELLQAKVIKMILQPILENAITHGLEDRMVKGNLLFAGKLSPEGDIEILIKDDGLGMSQAKLEAIRAELASGDEFLDRIKNSEHLGVVNVHSRLRSVYGEPYGLTIQSAEGAGTEVVLRLPYKEG
ncbi:sensor histidine kinase [Paenibacillus contaminans]|uniref:sensor histidine kinase n=1 Tax=Paenibacillus contaminans TaxID=450362 RepID=UPI00131440DD|nr:histidine kinase [Paenibacillus contaminans]